MNQKWITALGMLTLLAVITTPYTAEAQRVNANDFAAHYNRYLYFKMSQSPRSAGMGGAYSALRGGELGLVGNPASLGFLERQMVMLRGEVDQVTSDHTRDILGTGASNPIAEADIRGLGAGYAYPFEWGALGIHYYYRDDDVGTGAYNLSARAVQVDSDLERHDISLTAAYNYLNELALGYRYSYVDWDMDSQVREISPTPSVISSYDEEFTGHLNHVGAQYLLGEQFLFGIDGHYGFGDWDVSGASGDGDPDSWGVRGGVAWNPVIDIPVLLTMDIKYEERDVDLAGVNSGDNIFGIHIGGEYNVYENWYFRGGYFFEDFDYDEDPGYGDEAAISGVTGGVGVIYQDITVDYGLIYSDTGGGGDLTHILGMTYEF